MPSRAVATATVALALLALPTAPPADAQDGGPRHCGQGLALAVKNPDLQPRPNGFVHASGDVLIQLQVVGDRALDVAKVTLSLGKPAPRALVTCDGPEWITGAYVKDYRADADPRDGFTIAMDTADFPDGEYALAFHAYDADGNELTRHWTRAVLANGCAPGPCADDSADEVRAHDRVAPWPLVLPGDGVQTNRVGGLTVEFAEPVGADDDGAPHVRAFVNDVRIPLARVEGEARDDDAVPHNPVDDAPVKRRVLGPTFHWPGVVRTEDVVRVVAFDQNGNRAEKVIHVGDPDLAARVPAPPVGAPDRGLAVEEDARAAREVPSAGAVVALLTAIAVRLCVCSDRMEPQRHEAQGTRSEEAGSRCRSPPSQR